ncbi:MAG: arginine--tRNA ligase [Geminicoccaceae bacterium]|nr:arginine--tRNA ligase [Geminicoccaceae bacterium]
MSAFARLAALVRAALARLQERGELPRDLSFDAVVVEPPRDPAHGEAATNAALLLAKPAGKPPMELARALAAALAREPEVVAARAAPPGFVNLDLDPDFWRAEIRAALEAGTDYGRLDLGRGRPVNVEYCSANPTGPLHVGHGRGTVVGDALANLLAHMGYRVTREYYVNDAGAQIEALARSVHLRYREALGEPIGSFPEGLYPGEYLVPVGRALAERYGDRYRTAPESEWLDLFGREAVAAMLARIREDLAALGVRHDVFTSERALVEAGKVEEALDFLKSKGLLYTGTLPAPKGKPIEDWEPVPQLLFKATAFGDDTDRPLKRSTGHWTYFAADIAYHLDKWRRGFDWMIDVWGADHAGYVKRLQAAVKAFSDGAATLDVRLCQLVNLLDGGKPLRMSKRAGRIVTLRDVVEEVGKDVFRFVMLTRKNDAPLDFDLVAVTEQSKDNPVFYVQYAHARICSVFRHAREQGFPTAREELVRAPLERLSDPAELALVRALALWPRCLEQAARHGEPHRLAFFLVDLAGLFHALWTKGKERPELRFLVAEDRPLALARLALLAAVRTVIAAGLGIIGVQPVEELG